MFMSHQEGSAHQRCPGLAALICRVHVGACTGGTNTQRSVSVGKWSRRVHYDFNSAVAE